jgi:hypothetical protein
MKELKRWYQYVNGEPAMCLAPLFVREKKQAYVICLSAAWKYREPEHMIRACGLITEIFDLGFSSKRLARIATFIEDGLDELVRMKPEAAVYDDKQRVIGEAEISIDGGIPFSADILDSLPRGTLN